MMPVVEKPVIDLEAIRQPVIADLKAVDALICNKLISNVPLIQDITQHIIASGGKRLRPLLVVLSARALACRDDKEHLELAAIIEFVHTATLLHDDVVDESHLRRGQKTANALWGNQASVLVGDFLYSRAFQILSRRANVPVMIVLANTTNAIAEGEVLQLMNRNDPEISENIYMQVIHNKTAKLFESATEVGAIVATDNTAHHKAMAAYGLHLGLAFQIVDDVLDYTASADTMGKNVGDDLNEGKATLPLIYALKNTDKATATLIQKTIECGGLEDWNQIMQAIRDTKACEYSIGIAKQHADKALDALAEIPDSAFKQSLVDLVAFVVARTY